MCSRVEIEGSEDPRICPIPSMYVQHSMTYCVCELEIISDGARDLQS